MVETFRSRIAGYQRLPEPVVLGQILKVSQDNVELFFRSIVEGGGPAEEELEPFRESARNRATEGMPLEDLLHAYRLGGRMGWAALLEEATDEERPSLLAGAELLMDYIDRVSSVVAQTYLDERQALVSEEERRLRDLVECLCSTDPVDPGLRALAERIGLPLAEEYVPFAQSVEGAGAGDHAQIASTLRSSGVLALTEGDRVAGLAPRGWRVPEPDDPRVLLAVGPISPRAELADALDEARLLVDLGRQLWLSGHVSAEDFLPELLLARSPRIGGIVRRRALGPLESYAERRGSDLLDTLEAFIDSGLDRRAAAETLHVHPNTLDYRLKRAEELTGLSPGRPQDLLLLSLALKQRALVSKDN
jgi:hypothetical protein